MMEDFVIFHIDFLRGCRAKHTIELDTVLFFQYQRNQFFQLETAKHLMIVNVERNLIYQN